MTSDIVQYRNAIIGAGGSLVASRLGNMARSWLRSGRNRGNNSRNNGRRLSTALRQRLSRSRTLTQTRTRRFQKSGIGVTGQHDQRLVYKRRPMPKFKKRRWKAFKNKVAAVSEKDLGTRSVLFNRTVNYSTTNATRQLVGTFAVYGLESSESPLNDLYAIRNFENALAGTPALGDTVWPTTKFIFKSGIVDMTIRNSSVLQSAPGVYTTDSRGKLELDVYELSMSKFAETLDAGGATYTNWDNLEQVLNAMVNEEYAITDTGVAGAKINLINRGATPFDNTYALSRFGIKIWKKTKYTILAGDSITYQMRDPKRRVIDRKGLGGHGGFNMPGWTKFVVLVAKVIPGVPVGSAVGEFTQGFDVGVTRKYTYKIQGITDDRSIYFPST